MKNNLPLRVMSVLEHQELTQKDFAIKSDFDWLIACDFDMFTTRYQRGNWRLKIGHYIGVVLLPSGISLEILPKTTQILDPKSINESRRWVCQMLSDLSQNKVTPKQQSLGQFSPNLAANSESPAIIDWLMAQFLTLLTTYRPSLDYQSQIQQQSILQGKLILKAQWLSTATGKLTCEVNQRSSNLMSNRLIKSALLLFTPQFSSALQSWQPILPLTPPERRQLSASYQAARSEIHAQASSLQTKQNARLALDFAYWLLSQQPKLHSGGAVLSRPNALKLCLFVNMNQAFERWAGLCIAHEFKHLGYQAIFQPRDVWLYANDGAAYLSIQPDLLIYENNQNQPKAFSHVIDMKWKSWPKSTISASDAYQLTSYAQAYQAKNVWLVYPVTDNQARPIRLQQRFDLEVSQASVNPSVNQAPIWLKPFNVITKSLNHNDVKPKQNCEKLR